ncbi:MAG: lipocalin family protein [Runella sp.]
MNRIVACFLGIILWVGLSQCNVTSNGNEDGPAPVGVSKTELLAGTQSREWRLTSSLIDGREVFQQAQPCVRDDKWVFRVNKTYEINEGLTKCRTQDPQVYETGTWKFGAAEAELILNETARYKIITLNTSTLRISIRNVFGETEELTFTNQ